MEKKQHPRNRNTIRWAALVGLIVLALLASSCSGNKPKVYRVGILLGLDYFVPAVEGFKAGMTELGYVEGENIVYDVQSTDFDMAAYRRIAEGFVEDKVDLIFALPTEAALEAKAAAEGTDIPVVFANANTEGVSLVDSVREPGGNITGVRYPGVELALRRFETMRELAPEAKRFWVAYQRGYGNVTHQLAALYPGAEAAGITLIEVPADNAAEVEADLQARAASDDPGMDAIILLSDPLSAAPDALSAIGTFANEHQIPVGHILFPQEDFTPVFGVTIDIPGGGKQAAALADKVLNGTQAGTIPVVSPDQILTIDYTVAQKLGLTVPDGLLRLADEVVR